MHRRQFLAAAPAGAALLAGCYSGSGADEDPTATETETATPRPTTATFATLIQGIGKTSDGALVATILVENRASSERTATLTVTAKAGNETQTVTRDLSIPADGSKTVELTFANLSREAFSSNGSFPTISVE